MALASGCLLTMVSACQYLRQEGTLEAEEISVEDCPLASPFRLNLDFIAYWDCDDVLQMRFQAGGRSMAESDGVSLQINGWKELLTYPTSGEVTLVLPHRDVDLSVYLFRHCPDHPVVLHSNAGELTLVALEPGNRGNVQLHGWFDLTLAETGEPVSSGATLVVDGQFAVSSPARDFSVCP